ncbi:MULTISPECIES: site-specific integrase [Vibrio]|uniref:site-specific integrase n=1 Tax=Vibrio TaxID=662 RepID=UPI0003184499|nr:MULTISPECIES: site-specific integrase [Vibrio]OEE52398.1 site-specific recombinase [Vibrio splendidus FF-500]TCW02599.1 site-specific recombinase XerD [Vibrio crassostreae]CAK3276517.1 Site-specific recombinase [Vibrio crassostreae]CAK3578883.1 Site-specific recombinase [Vibrio crassostreae]CAK3972915.1 Site-specific recombinase [Vibrio crassostreae]
MSTVVVAKTPDLTFLVTSRRRSQEADCPLPLILKKGGRFDWHANSFITEYGGSSQSYNIRPLAKTVKKKAYSLNLFCNFIEEESICVHEINDSTLYQYADILKGRGVFDDTVLKHGRTAIEYIEYLSKNHPDWKLATSEEDSDREFGVHYDKRKYKNGYIEKEYLHHDSLEGLIYIAAESEYIRDYELIMWLDAINCSTYHPKPNDFLISRWEALTTLLEITGSRISEVHQITRTMIKNASDSLLLNERMPVIRNIPIRKGKYKGKYRNVITTDEDIQVILIYVYKVEDMFPDMDHDALFVDSKTGNQLKPSYLKNYTKKIINDSKYCDALKHLSNHSFRHRFITLNVAKAIRKMSSTGSFSNILSVAANACRKVTMHASNETLSHYVHLASEINYRNDDMSKVFKNTSTQITIRINKMMTIATLLRSKEIKETEALNSLLSTLDELKKFD